MTEESDANAMDLRAVDGRELANQDSQGLALDVVPDEENGTVTFIAADADVQDTRTAWLTADASSVVDVTEMQ